MKIKHRNHEFIYVKGCYITDTKIVELNVPSQGVKIFKFTYNSYNGGEDFCGEMFDGARMNRLFNMQDLGEVKVGSVYLLFTENEAKNRIEMLTKKGENFIQKLF